MKKFYSDYIVVGAGIAGLTVANKLGEKSQVTVFSKNKYKESATYLAQGGIACAMQKGDNPKLHYEDTLKAGDGLCDEKHVRILVEEGIVRVQELIDLGMKFDMGEEGDFAFTKEGAHSKRRILHAKDKTGKIIEDVLFKNATMNKNIKIVEYSFVLQLVVRQNKCIGVFVKNANEVNFFYAKAVILATGGAGQIYEHNSNPPSTTGDGIALAYDAGALVQDMEFIQFHPTTLYTGDKRPISIFLISEAVRGEGAVLRNLYGERFMKKYHVLEELAPRDVVSRAIISEMKKTKSDKVFLDLTGIKIDIKKRFPTIYKRTQEAKIDVTKDFIPVVPAVHYFMGGVKVDEYGETQIKRLFAVGEVSSNGIHGANRLASNSLLDGLVFGARASKKALGYMKFLERNIDYVFEDYNQSIHSDLYAQILAIKQEIRHIMWSKVGIIRDEKNLNEAFKILKSYAFIFEIKSLQENVIEVQNMLKVALLVTEFALQRKESRGAHFRKDFPKRNDDYWLRHQVK